MTATQRFVWKPVRLPDLESGVSDRLSGKRITVIGGTGSLAAKVESALGAHGAVIVTPDSIDLDGIVDLTLDEAQAGWEPALLRSIGAIRGCYQAWAEHTAADRIFYLAVTYFGGGMGYRDLSPRARPLGGIWAGLAKTLHQEMPNCNSKVIDIDPASAADLPEIISRELYRWGTYEIGYRDGKRFTISARRQDPAKPSISLGADDVVLISGGGRGIGFALATSLARNTGCRVVITGRHPLPEGDEPWADLDDEAFKSYQREMWSDRGSDRTLTTIRAESTSFARRRDLAANLKAAHAGGLRIQYEVCDFVDQQQVSDLLARIGPELSGVVHNAGVDAATRLPKMSDEDVLRTVRTKIDGFLNLFTPLRNRRLKFFCNVGSMSGRLGGMVGQIAYAAANDGLARLGLWAGAQAEFPVMTLCWPTWERLGLITNYEAALRYMTAIGVEEGLRRWQEELLAPSNGEITFLGALGSALHPVQVMGFPLPRELLDFDAVYPKIFHLGIPETYQPGEELVSHIVLDSRTTPLLADSDTAVVGLLLESALASAEWVQPDGESVVWNEIRDLVVHLDLLRPIDFTVELERTTRRTGSVVEVRFQRRGVDGPVAELRLFSVQPRSTTRVIDLHPADIWALPLTPPLAMPFAATQEIIRRTDSRTVRLSRLRTDLETTMQEDHDTVLAQVAEVLAAVVGDYDGIAESITRDTDLHTDLQFESTGADLFVLAGHLAHRFGGRADLFGYLGGLSMDELIGLKVGSLVDAIVDQLASGRMAAPPPAPLPTTLPPAPVDKPVTPQRFLFVVPPLTGHTNPTIGVAARLAERGHRVAWAGNAEAIRPLVGPKAEVFDCAVPVSGVDWMRRPPEIRSMLSIKVMWEDLLIPLADAMVPGVRAAVAEFQPDVMVADQQALAGTLVAGATGTPWATSASLSAELLDPYAALPEVSAWLRNLLQGLQSRHGDPRTGIDLRFSPDLVLSYTTEDLVGPIPRREPIAYVGPSIHPRPSTVDFPWDRLDRDRSLVLISLGTISLGVGSGFLSEAVTAARSLSDRVQAVVVDPTGALGTSTDDDVIIMPSVPQLELLDRVDAVVCHAGHNTVCESLARSIPLVVAPIRDDQPIVAAQVEAAGAGIQLRFGLAKARHIEGALRAVLDDPKYRKAAGAIRDSFERAGGAATAADHLEAFAARKGKS